MHGLDLQLANVDKVCFHLPISIHYYNLNMTQDAQGSHLGLGKLAVGIKKSHHRWSSIMTEFCKSAFGQNHCGFL